jgi:hypothetical protein
MIRGKSTYFPFRPGGLPSSYQLIEDEAEDVVVRTERAFEEALGGIQTVPPGFERGLDFDEGIGQLLQGSWSVPDCLYKICSRETMPISSQSIDPIFLS